ncbi:MAG: hypothetical protein U5N58_12970 [Actinomycetota bacterium]|nr:hypothetical protein [Actinomycetota bacterium]
MFISKMFVNEGTYSLKGSGQRPGVGAGGMGKKLSYYCICI